MNTVAAIIINIKICKKTREQNLKLYCPSFTFSDIHGVYIEGFMLASLLLTLNKLMDYSQLNKNTIDFKYSMIY